jgi:hypothetical protein
VRLLLLLLFLVLVLVVVAAAAVLVLVDRLWWSVCSGLVGPSEQLTWHIQTESISNKVVNISA